MDLRVKPFGGLKVEDFHLPIEITVYVPGTKAKKVPISKLEFKRRISLVDRKLRSLFGGYTTVTGDGGYTADNGDVIRESVAKVTSFVKKGDYIAKRGELLKFIRVLRVRFQQESIGYEIEGDLHYIS